MTVKDATDILPWHIASDLEDAGSLLVPESFYYYIKELLEENDHLVGLLEDMSEVIGRFQT